MSKVDPAEKTVSVTGDHSIRVLQVLLTLEPGGLENGVVNLSNGLDSGSFQTRIVCLERFGAFVERLGSRVSVVSLDKRAGFSLYTAWRLAREIRRFRPHVIHTHNLGPLIYGSLARLLAFPIRTCLLHGEHGTLHGTQVLPRRLWQRRCLYRFCSKVHTVSVTLRQHFCELGFPGEKMVAVINGVDCARFSLPADRRELRRVLGMPEDALVLGMIGRLIPSKRHDLFLEALARLPASLSGRPVHALIVGEGGDLRNAIKDAAENHSARDRLRWMGHQEDPVPCYQVLDLLVMPSSVEGLSNALLESMACGVPCLAHPACGASEVIEDGENGWLTEMPTGAVLAGRLETLLEEPARLKVVGSRARDTVVRRFSLEVMIARYAELFEEVAGR